MKPFLFLKYIIHKAETALEPLPSIDKRLWVETPWAPQGCIRGWAGQWLPTGTPEARIFLGPPGHSEETLCQGELKPRISQPTRVQTINFLSWNCWKGQSWITKWYWKSDHCVKSPLEQQPRKVKSFKSHQVILKVENGTLTLEFR